MIIENLCAAVHRIGDMLGEWFGWGEVPWPGPDGSAEYGDAGRLLSCRTTLSDLEASLKHNRDLRNALVVKLSNPFSPDYRGIHDLVELSGLSYRSVKRVISCGTNTNPEADANDGEEYADEFRALTRAQTAICVYGWIQGEAGDEVAGYCTLGALQKATEELWGSDLRTDDDGHPYARSEEVFASSLEILSALVRDEGFLTVACWNDAPGRTKQEVLTLFAEAASSHART